MTLVINNNIYFFKWTLADMRRLEQLCGCVAGVCSINGSSYKNLCALLWTGLYEDNYHGEREHVFHQQLHGFKAAQAMWDIIVEEHPGDYEARSFVFVNAYEAMMESGWFIEPSQTTTKGAVVATKAQPSEVPTLFYETYQKGIKSLAYGMLNIRPGELERYTPAEVIDMVECAGAYAVSKRMELDILVATVKQVMLGVAGVQQKVEDMMVWREEVVAPSEPMSDNEVVGVMKQWVVATGGKTI